MTNVCPCFKDLKERTLRELNKQNEGAVVKDDLLTTINNVFFLTNSYIKPCNRGIDWTKLKKSHETVINYVMSLITRNSELEKKMEQDNPATYVRYCKKKKGAKPVLE